MFVVDECGGADYASAVRDMTKLVLLIIITSLLANSPKSYVWVHIFSSKGSRLGGFYVPRRTFKELPEQKCFQLNFFWCGFQPTLKCMKLQRGPVFDLTRKVLGKMRLTSWARCFLAHETDSHYYGFLLLFFCTTFSTDDGISVERWNFNWNASNERREEKNLPHCT